MAVDAVSAAAAAQSTTAKKSLSGNFDTFLRLLTTQLQHQDPLEPLDSTKFTEQLVSYSQVEQQINTNDKLASLIAVNTAAIAGNAVNYLGKTALTSGPLSSLDGGSASWRYTVPGDVKSVKLTVIDEKGNVVRTVDGDKTAGMHEFVWDGKNTAGTALPKGIYRLKIAAKDFADKDVDVPVSGLGLVKEIDMSSGEPIALVGTRLVRLSEIMSLKN